MTHASRWTTTARNGCLRGPALGRKNYYGSGSLWSGRLAAALFSILATLKLWQINPRLWLQWYLQSCAEAGGQAPKDIEPFLPWNLSEEMRAKLAPDCAGAENRHELIPERRPPLHPQQMPLSLP